MDHEEFISIPFHLTELRKDIPYGGMASCRPVKTGDELRGEIYVVTVQDTQILCRLVTLDQDIVLLKNDEKEMEISIERLAPVLKVVYFTMVVS